MTSSMKLGQLSRGLILTINNILLDSDKTQKKHKKKTITLLSHRIAKLVNGFITLATAGPAGPT